MADGVSALGNLLCRTDATGALVVGVDGSSALLYPLRAPDGTVGAPSYSWASEPTSGFYRSAPTDFIWATGGVPSFRFIASTFVMSSTGTLAWGSTGISGADVGLSRGAADRLALASGDSFHVISGAIGVNTVPGVAGSVTATSFIGNGAGLTGIAGVTGGVSNIGNTTLIADSDNNGSGIIDFTTGLTSKWQVSNAGHLTAAATGVQLLVADGTTALPSISFASDTNLGFFQPAANSVMLTNASLGIIFWQTGLMQMGSAVRLSWSPSADASGATGDLTLGREGPDHLIQRNYAIPATAQRASWMNTYGGATIYESFSIDWQTVPSTVLIGSRTAATGTGREIQIASQTTNAVDSYVGMRMHHQTAIPIRIGMYTAAGVARSVTGYTTFLQLAERTSIDTTGTVVSVAITPTYNQAASTASNTDLLINRTQTAVGSGAQLLIDAQVGGVSQFSVSNTGTAQALNNLSAPIITSSGLIRWNSNGSRMQGVTDGVITLTNAAQTDFSRLQFGGTTAAFPSLKRVGTIVDVRLADDSSATAIRASGFLMANGSQMLDSTDGVIRLLNAAGSDFSRLQFGGGTAAFPALKRASTSIQAVLADDSGFAPLTASTFTSTTGVVAMSTVSIRTGTGSPEGVVALPVGTLFMRTDGTAGATFYVKETGAATSTGWVAK